AVAIRPAPAGRRAAARAQRRWSSGWRERLSALFGRTQSDRPQVEPVDRLGELVACRYAVIAELQSDHALCARHAIGLGGAQQEIRNDGPVADEQIGR